MATNSLPAEGELRIGAVVLPVGRRVVPMDGAGEPVAWVTAEPVPDAGLAWSALSDAPPGDRPGADPADQRRGG